MLLLISEDEGNIIQLIVYQKAELRSNESAAILPNCCAGRDVSKLSFHSVSNEGPQHFIVISQPNDFHLHIGRAMSLSSIQCHHDLPSNTLIPSQQSG